MVVETLGSGTWVEGVGNWGLPLKDVPCPPPFPVSLSGQHKVSDFTLPFPSTMVFCLTTAQKNRANWPYIEINVWNQNKSFLPYIALSSILHRKESSD